MFGEGAYRFLHFPSLGVRRVFAALFIPFCIFGHDRDIYLLCSLVFLMFTSILGLYPTHDRMSFYVSGILCKCWHVLEVGGCVVQRGGSGDPQKLMYKRGRRASPDAVHARCEIEYQGQDGMFLHILHVVSATYL
jgi:hypothetical protein